MNAFDEKLQATLSRSLPGFESLTAVERLSGGASQETYRLEIEDANGPRVLALRRAPGGVKVEPTPGHPGLDVEALLMQSARAVGVPEPEVFHVLTDVDDLGDGFIMEWLDGIALGARIVRSPDLDEIRPKLAFLSGEILAKIHAIDLVQTTLDRKLDVISPGDYVEQTWERYRLFETTQPMIDYAARWLMEIYPTALNRRWCTTIFATATSCFPQMASSPFWIGK